MARFGHNPHDSMQHLNGNLLCAVDVETTGLLPGHHDVIQIAVLPLDGKIKPLKTIMPFYMDMKPKFPENVDKKAMTVTNIDYVKLMSRAIEPWRAVDLFEEWFKRLNLPERKRIVPLATNYLFDKPFIEDWLGGPKNYDAFFHPHFRDTMVIGAYFADRADQHSVRIPFPKLGLGEMASNLNIKNLKAHDALQDCFTTAELYRKVLFEFTPNFRESGQKWDQTGAAPEYCI